MILDWEKLRCIVLVGLRRGEDAVAVKSMGEGENRVGVSRGDGRVRRESRMGSTPA